MEAPEKIYLFENPINNTLDDRWLSKKSCDDDIEYIRKDVFIEKVARFLEYTLNDRVEIRVAGTLTPLLTDKKTFVEDFKNYMEG